MDAFSPQQFKHIRHLIHRCTSSRQSKLTRHGQHLSRDGARRALLGIGILNLPALLLFRAIEAWPELFIVEPVRSASGIGSWLVERLNEFDIKIFDPYLNAKNAKDALIQAATEKWYSRLAFTPVLALERPWTFLTSSFTETSSIAVAGNILSLSALWPQLSRLPGLDALHVIFLAVGSSVVANTAIFAEDIFLPNPTGFSTWGAGAAPVVAGFGGLCAAETLHLCLNYDGDLRSGKLVPALFATVTSLGGGLTILLRRLSRPAWDKDFWQATLRSHGATRSALPDNLGIMAATIFGVAYYHFFLKPARPRAFVSETRRLGGEERQFPVETRRLGGDAPPSVPPGRRLGGEARQLPSDIRRTGREAESTWSARPGAGRPRWHTIEDLK